MDNQLITPQTYLKPGVLPPGQRKVDYEKWPILKVGKPPEFNPDTWTLKIHGLVEHELELSWADFLALPSVRLDADMHCVTHWTIFDMHWIGVDFYELVKRVQPKASAVSIQFKAFDDVSYTSSIRFNHNQKLSIPSPQLTKSLVDIVQSIDNLGFRHDTLVGVEEYKRAQLTNPIQEVELHRVLLATHNHDTPLSPEHGGPMRMIIPDLYAWKGVKWCQEIEFKSEHELGFWEKFGYNDIADPSIEARVENLAAQRIKADIYRQSRQKQKPNLE